MGRLYYQERPIRDAYFGPGWAWDDYGYYYLTEKSGMPVYANVVRFQFKEHLPKPLAYPSYFTSFVDGFPDATLNTSVRRAQYQNRFVYGTKADTLAFTRDVPFIQSSPTLLRLLEDTLQQRVRIYRQPYRQSGSNPL